LQYNTQLIQQQNRKLIIRTGCSRNIRQNEEEEEEEEESDIRVFCCCYFNLLII